jgi:hypothetical protein
MAVVVALVGVLAAITIWASSSVMKKQDHNDTSRDVVVNLRHARSLAVMGGDLPPAARAPSPPAMRSLARAAALPSAAAQTRVKSAGIRVIDVKSYEVFVDGDSKDGGERTIEIVQLPRALEIAAPAPGSLIRFIGNGTVAQQSPMSVTVRNTDTGETQVVDIEMGGSTAVR